MLNKPLSKNKQPADLLLLLVILSEEPNGNFKNRRGPWHYIYLLVFESSELTEQPSIIN